LSVPIGGWSQAPNQTGGQTNSVIVPVAAGVAPYYGAYIPFLFGRLDLPSSPNAQSGSVLYYAPPVDLVLGSDGWPEIDLRDHKTLGDGAWLSVDGREMLCRTAREVAGYVAARKVDAAARVNVSFTLRLHDALDLKDNLRQTCLQQLRNLDTPNPAQPPRLGVDQTLSQVVPVPPQEMWLECDTDGLKDFRWRLPCNPSLRNEMDVQVHVPAKFVCGLFTKAGLNLRLTFAFEAYGDTVTEVTARQAVQALVDVLLDGQGQGDFQHRIGDRGGDYKILTTRDAIDRVREHLKASNHVIIRGATSEDINLLMGLMQRNDVDLTGAAANQIEEVLSKAFDMRRLLTEPGVTKAVEKSHAWETLTEEELERFQSSLRAVSTASQGGGGFSLGPISFGGGGGGSKSVTEADKKYWREAYKHFAQDLQSYRQQGHWPVHPNLKYRILSTQDITKEYTQYLVLARAGKVTRRILSSPFNTRRVTLQPTAAEIFRKKQAEQEKLDKKLEELGGTTHSKG
jgi:hypothetical protein